MTRDQPNPIHFPPMDEHNRQLVSHVHPPDWENPAPAGRYNLVVVGGGTAGLVTAAGAAGLGARIALVERHLLGGDCLNVGCVPSKCLISAAKAFANVRDAGRYGVQVPDGARVDFPAVMARMRRLRAGISHHDSAQRFRGLGIDVFLGQGRFSGPNTIEVEGKTLEFSRAVIATGARASAPPIPGLEEAGYLTNETVFGLTALPASLAVIGAGPIGCELAQSFQRFGAQVYLLEVLPQIMTREDQEAAQIVHEAMQRDGVKIILSAQIRKVERRDSRKVLHVETAQGGQEIAVNEILVGAGRRPNVEGLELKSVGVEYDPKRGVRVNDFLQTSNPRIYAAGDICSPYQFTHTADAMARIVIQNALFLGRKKVSRLTIPWATFTDPEVAHVGLYEKDAEEKGFGVDTFRRELRDVDRAIADGETEGFVKIHVKRGKDEIVGATVVARHAGDLISEITLAMVGGVGLGTIASVIHPYPTQAEAIRQTGDAYNRTRLTPFVKSLFQRWLAWRR